MASAQVTNGAHDLKKPTSAYWLWLGDNRKRIEDMLGTRKGPDVAKKAGELWKAMSEAERQPYEQKAKEQKEAYEKFLATDEGKQALSDKKLAKAEAKSEKNDRACKAAVKAVEKDDALKKPQTAYWLWLGDNRKRVEEMCGTKKGSDVSKKAGELWKTLTDADRQPYEQKAKEQKEAYEQFLASDEGASKLKEFKEAKQAAKDQFKATGKADPQEKGEENASPAKKRGAAKEIAPPSKRGRGAKASLPEEPTIPEDVLQEAEKLRMDGPLKNLMSRAEVAASGKSPKQVLAALQHNGGLVNKAKAALLGA